MRDMRDAGDARVRDMRGLRGFCLKSLLTLMTLLTLFIANAEGLQPRRTLGNRLGRPTAAASQPQPSTSTSDSAAAESGGRSIEFNAAPVDLVLDVYGTLVKRTVLKDPKVQAVTITLQPRKEQKLTEEDKIEAIETVLEMNGVHLESFGEKFVRALPRKDVRKEGIPLYLDEKALDADVEAGKIVEGKVISFMIRFKYLSEEDTEQVASKVLESFKSDASGAPIVLKKGRQILVTDTYVNIKRMLEILPEIDVEVPAEPLPEVECIQIQNASASDIVPVIEKIVQDSLKEQEELEKKGAAQAAGAKSQQTVSVRPLLGRLNQGRSEPSHPTSQAALVINASEAAHGIIKGRVTVIAEPKSNKIILITKSENMQMFKKIIAELDVPTDKDVRVYRLKYAEAEEVADMLNDLKNEARSNDSKKGTGGAKQGSSSANLTRNTQSSSKAPGSKVSESLESAFSGATFLHDKRINGLVVMAERPAFPTIEKVIESMDIKLSQVLIETCIIEVTLGDGLNTGVDWVLNGRDKTDGDMEKGNMVNGDRAFASMLGGGGGSGKALLEGVMSVASNAVGSAHDFMGTASPIGGGINYIFKSEALNLAAVVSASKTDSRSKYIASPVIMTLDNKEAVIEATDARQFLSGWQAVSGSYAGSGLPSPNYSAKDIGIKLKITPKINPNGTVMLQVEEEYSQAVQTQSMMTPVDNHYEQQQVDVPSTRTMQSDVLLENGQTVVFGGLTETTTTDKENGIPILKDIPIVGKWLFGKVEKKEDRKELLVFMTPYVLDDAQAAQAEALRRKKTISDPRPWDDHGWSASALADPVSKQEQMRRIKDEWRIQDEERRTRIAIEREKVNRVKKLQEMSKDEREMWLKMHKAELEEEAQDELEEKMLDEKSQEELKKLAAQIREQKLNVAEKELKAAEAEAAAENERGKLDAAKKAEGEAKKGE